MSGRGNNDWFCGSCFNLVFGSKSACRCGYQRPATSMKPGDWNCLRCGGLVFASKSECGKCHTPKPKAMMPQQQLQQSSQMQKPGDWNCPGCNNLVFASKDQCGRCHTPKPRADAPQQQQPQQLQQSLPMQKPGDWNCPGCNNLVFASKDQCGRCHTPKPRADAPQQQQPQQLQQSSPMQKPGDWNCPGCNNLVFASKAHCGRCGASKPNPNLFSSNMNQPLTNSTNPFTFVNTDVNNNNNNVQFSNTNPFGGLANIQSGVNPNNYSNNMGGANMAANMSVKPGDWRCTACNENNFASRQNCYKCRAARPGANLGNPNMAPQQAPQAQQAKFAGDWNCNCGASNFGSRTVCFKCATPRPDLSTSTKEDDGLCVICMCEPSCFVIQDCGHLCLCQGCASNDRVNTCPMCRAPVRSVLKVFKA